jgi:hypothetical protein
MHAAKMVPAGGDRLPRPGGRRVILAIDRDEPDSHEALARIPGLGPAKILRFGDDILDLVRQHRARES